MKRYIYYPNFEPPNDEWLRFAILYLDRIDSIVPDQVQHLVSRDFQRLQNETDLVEMFSPTDSQGYRATLNAIPESKRFLSRSFQYSGLFNRMNVRRDWRDESNWDYQIHYGKFSYQWIDYCLRERIGRETNDGIILSRSLAFLYMTHLAKEIAFDRDGSIITDNRDYDHYTSYARGRTIQSHKRNQFIKNVIQLKVPQNLSTISLDHLIKFRNNNFDLIRAFNSQIDKIEHSIGNGLSEQQFIDEYNYTANSLITEILSLGLQALPVPLTFYILAQNVDALNQEYLKETLTSLGIFYNGQSAIRKSLYDNREQRWCKKYLVRLSQLR